MDALPETLSVLDNDLRTVRRLKRVVSGSPLYDRLAEKDYDRLIVEHSEAIGEVLRAAELMGAESKLRVLGTQVDGIDVLLAEVDTDDRLRRLVLVEDKLLRNPEARRSVIAQILEYRQKVQDDWEADDLPDGLGEHATWLSENREQLERVIKTGDVLLLICGDRIHANARALVQRFSHDLSPMARTTFGMISLAIYSDGTQHVLVPHIVGVVARAERDLTIRVTDAQGGILRAELVDEPEPTESEDGLERWRSKFGEQHVAACGATLDAIRKAQIDGIWFSSRPAVHYGPGNVLGQKVKLLQARLGSPTIRDTMEKRYWSENVVARDARDEFRRFLTGLPGHQIVSRDRVAVPATVLAENAQALVDALKRLVKAIAR